MKTVSQKMRLKPGYKSIIIGATEDVVDSMSLPALVMRNRLSGDFDYIHYFVVTQAEFSKKFDQLKKHLAPSGSLWISWPKGGQLGSDLTLPKVINIGYSFGLVESTCMRVDKVWSALKFTHPKPGKKYNNSFGELTLSR